MVAAAAAARHSPEPLSMLAADRTRISGRTAAADDLLVSRLRVSILAIKARHNAAGDSSIN
jgi:hypothetical protein